MCLWEGPSISKMANAMPEECDNGCSANGHCIDSDAEDAESASTSKQNGSAYLQTDRYGFVGGDQYTDPTQ